MNDHILCQYCIKKSVANLGIKTYKPVPGFLLFLFTRYHSHCDLVAALTVTDAQDPVDTAKKVTILTCLLAFLLFVSQVGAHHAYIQWAWVNFLQNLFFLH